MMTPEEIADLLITHHNCSKLPQLIEKRRFQLDTSVLEVIATRILDERRRNSQRAFQWLQPLKSVADAIGTPESQARFTWIQGLMYLYLNRYQEAMLCFQELEPFYYKQGEMVKVAGMQINQMIILRELGKYQEALSLAEQARILCQALGKPAEKYWANLEHSIGWIYEEMGDVKAALIAYEQARTIHEKVNDQVSIAGVDLNRAHLFQSLDQFIRAESLLKKARSVWCQTEHYQSVARVDLNLGILAYKQGQYQKALQYLEEAYIGFDAIPLPVEVAVVDLHRSFVYRYLNLNQEMMALAAAAGQVFKRKQMHREYILCLVNQAVGHWQQQQFPDAARLLTQARRKLYQQGAWWKLWLIDTDRADLLLTMGQVKSARRIARRVQKQVDPEQYPSLSARLHLLLARCALTQQPANQVEAQVQAHQALELAQAHYLTEIQAQAHYVLSIIQILSGSLEAAWQQIQQAIRACEQLRLYLSQDELQVHFMADKLSLYQQYIRLAHKRVDQHPSGSTQLLTSLILAHTAPLSHVAETEPGATLPAKEQARLTTLRQEWRWFQNKLESPEQVRNVPAGIEERSHIHQKLHQIEREMADLMRRQRVRYSAVPITDVDALVTLSSQPVLETIQRHLHPQDVLLHYYVVDDCFQAFVVTQTDIGIISDLVPIKTLQRLWQSWRFHVQHIYTTVHQPQASIKMAQAYLTRLYRVLISPLLSFLTACEHIYLVLPPEWHELPMAALFDGQDYLIERYALTYLSSPDVLLRANALSQVQLTLAEKPQALVVGYSENGRLPHTLTEAQTITDVLSEQWQTQQVIEAEATLETFRRACQESHLLHLATHAVFRPDNPYFSWIRLADVRLTVTDLYDIQLLQHPFIVLSACETGQGTARGGGVLGMGRGFLAAGASGLVVTLWRISDAYSSHLMGDFYQVLASPVTARTMTVALQQVQQRAAASQIHPFYWAGFIFVGG